METKVTCIICPRGCALTAEKLPDGSVKISGNGCIRGERYGTDEFLHPVRTLTSTVRVNNRDNIMLSVKSEEPIPKEALFEAMKKIRSTSVSAPVNIGDTVIDDFFGTRIIATLNIK